MNEYWQQQHGLTTSEKAAFVERVQAEQAEFLASLRTIHSQAENRMLTRVGTEKWADRANTLIDLFDDPKLPTTSWCMLTRVACRGVEDDEDGDDASMENVV
jgi:hypothetical protein